MKMKKGLLFLLLSIFITASCAEGPHKNARESYPLQLRLGAVQVRNKRGFFDDLAKGVGEAVEGVGEAVEGALEGVAGGIERTATDLLGIAKPIIDAVSNGPVGGLIGVAVSLIGKLIGKDDSGQRELMRMKEKQFQEEMDMRKNELCLQICASPWTPWTSCSAPCGGGTKTRQRSLLGGLCEGRPCPHALNETSECNSNCANGGLPSNGLCQCTRSFSGRCCNNEKECPYPGGPDHGDAEPKAAAKYGGVISYKCSDGFALVGQSYRVCGDEQWEGDVPTCQKIICTEPATPEFGAKMNIKQSYFVGDEVYFRCNYGYELTGPIKQTCINLNGGTDGKWTGFTPFCLPVNCGSPGYPLNGIADGTEFLLGNIVNFSCRSGYRLIGSDRRECLPSGSWSGHEAKCELITCEAPIIPRHGQLRRTRDSYYIGLTITIFCEEGYTIEGSTSAICEIDPVNLHLGGGGKWSGEPPICKATNCGDPGTIVNGAKDGSLFYYPNNVTFVCFDGYTLDGAAEIHCNYNGIWTAPPPTCTACEENEYKLNAEGTNICSPCPENTHTATKASTRVQQCVCDLGFSGPPGGPCTEIVCPKLPAPGNGNQVCEGNKYQNKCNFKCDQGYILDKGSSQRTCQDSGKWTGTDAQCTACPMNTYKSDERSCLPCPIHSQTKNIASVKNQCLCDNGYEGPAGGPCLDANECLENGGKGKCDDVCRNTDGSYVCECSIPGYIIDADVDRHVCKQDKTCRNLTETDAPENGGLVCHWYYEENSQQCSVRCNAGYEFPSRTNNYETCGSVTGYKWSHEESGRKIESCYEEYFPDVRLEADSAYFVRNCKDLTPEEQQRVKEDFAKMLTDEGICIHRQSQVCDAKNVGIICGATKRRKRRGVSETVDDVNISFELAAKMLQPTDCDQICTMLKIRENDCERLCVPSYRRYLLALMKYTKRSIENLFNNTRKVNFQSGRRPMEYQSGSFKTSDVIVDCKIGMKNDETCVPCSPGTYYSKTDNECLKCPEHTFQADSQQTSCNACPIGTYAPSTGSLACISCPDNRWGERCSRSCVCEHGQCNSTSGKCVCSSGWEGPSCNIDIQSCAAESCYPGVKCHDIPAPGTGFKCDPCPPGFHGDGTICEAMRRRGKRHIMDGTIFDQREDVLQIASIEALNFGSHNFN